MIHFNWQILLGLVFVIFIGCSKIGSGRSSRAVDNTAVNIRDHDSSRITPFDQGENAKDIDITSRIRYRVNGSGLSFNANNIKIVTQNGRVTLRGPVESPEEKRDIEQIARGVAGVENIVSQIEVKSQD